MKNLLLLLLFLLNAVNVFSQKRFEVFKLSGNYNFMETAEGERNGNFETALSANLNLPVVLKNGSIFYSSVDYQYFSINNPHQENIAKEAFKLHGIIVRTGYIYKLNQTSAIQALFMPRFMGDFKASLKQSMQYGALLMYEKVKSDLLTWRAGILYNREIFGDYFVPVVYLDWSISEKVKVKGLLPVYGRIYKALENESSVGFHFIGLTTTYRISEENLVNHYVDRRSIDLSLFGRKKIGENLFIEGRLGYTLLRDYGLFAPNDKMDFALPLVNVGDNRTRLNEVSGASPFAHLRLIYSVAISD